jgi:hypothetical protein
MLRPVIMIGCGGAGLKTVRLVREGVQRRLNRAGWDGQFPNAWQFIGIDSSNYQEDPSIPTFPANDYISLVNHSTYTNIASAVDARFPQGSAGFREMMGWRPNSNNFGVPLNMAPPPARALGRMTFIASQDIVRQRVSRAFAECAVGGPVLSEVSQRLGVDVWAGTPVPAPITIVVGSMAGGTGAGIMLDVVDMLRRTDLKGAFPVMVAFTPDVFGSVVSDQMSANSAAFVSEFLSAYWDDEATDLALIPSVIRTGTRGPHSTFMIGRKTIDGLDLGNSLNVFRSVGDTLASVTTSAEMQSRFFHLGVVDWAPHARENNGGYGWRVNFMNGAVSSFGSATLSIGRDRFRQYLSRLLHRSIIEHLTDGFNSAAVSFIGESASKAMSAQAKISELGRIHRDEFMSTCQLSEKESFRQVSNAFVSNEQLKNEFQLIENHVKQAFSVTDQQNAGVWLQRIEAQAQTAKVASQSRAQDNTSAMLKEWGSELYQTVLTACTEFSARLSLPVAMSLVETARADLLESVGLMKEAAVADRKNADQIYAQAQTHLGSAFRGRLGVTSSPVQEAIKDYAIGICYEWSARVRDQLSVTLEAVATNMLNAIYAGIQQSLNRLTSLTTPQDGNPEVVSLWPINNGVVPISFAPSPVEFYLEDPRDWPEMARAILEKSLGEDRHLLPADPIEATRTLLIRGGFVGNRGDMVPPLISAETRKDGILSWSIEQPVEICTIDGLVDLEERVDSWLMRPLTETEECLNEGLSSYLSEVNPRTGVPVTNHTFRLAVFQQKLGEALGSSLPLIQIDREMNATVHPLEVRVVPQIQGFPFTMGHPARQIVEDVLTAQLPIGTPPNYFSSTDTESVSISSFMVNRVNPSVISSFTEPFAQSMSNIVNESLLRSSFWLWRRARTLENFIPLPDQLRLSAIRGFAIARSLGYCTASIDEVNRVVDHNGVHEFPKHLLTATNRNNVLPALLESMVLTFADAPIKGKDAFNAYGALINYGIGGRSVDQYALPSEMISFLNDNEFVYDVVDSNRQEKIVANDFDQRKENVLRYLDAYLQFLQQLDAKPLSNSHWRDSTGAVDPVDTLTLELMGDLTRGYTDVRTAVHMSEPPFITTAKMTV